MNLTSLVPALCSPNQGQDLVNESYLLGSCAPFTNQGQDSSQRI